MRPEPIHVILGEMLDSIVAIRAYTRSLTRDEFLAQPMIQDAVIRRIEILGEAANTLPSEWKQQRPEVPWPDIVRMRNRLIHGYFTVDVQRVWDTVQDDIPELEKQLRQIADE